MKAFIRDNLMIVVSIALPVLVVVLFAAASLLPRLYTDPPAHDLLLALDSTGIGDAQVPVQVDLSVSDGHLVAQIYQLERFPDGRQARRVKPRIFEYVAETDTAREIPLELPENVTELPDGTTVPIAELAGVRLVTTPRAPDGYELVLDRSGGGGLFRQLFGTSGGGWQPRIRKGGAIVEIDLPVAQPYYYGRVRFLGWVAAREPE